MGRATAEVKQKKAEFERDRAAQEARKAVTDTGKAVRDLAAALVEQVKAAGLDERAVELATRLRHSEAMHLAQERGRDLAGRTSKAIADTGLDERAAVVAARLRESDAAKQARQAAERLSDQALHRVGETLSHGKAAERLGVQPAKRRFPGWLAALLGVGAGYAIGLVTAPKRGKDLRDDLSFTADRLTQETRDVSAPPAEKPLEDKIRTRLGEDPRTSSLPRLNVNVAEGTVFVRGVVPEGFDESAIRDVVAGVEGVRDVDLRVNAGA